MTLAQDAHLGAFSSMPQSAIAAGCADLSDHQNRLPGNSPGSAAIHISTSHRRRRREQEAPRVRRQEAPGEEQEFQQILQVLRQRTNADFTAYKTTTLKRRIFRRMALLQIGQPLPSI